MTLSIVVGLSGLADVEASDQVVFYPKNMAAYLIEQQVARAPGCTRRRTACWSSWGSLRSRKSRPWPKSPPVRLAQTAFGVDALKERALRGSTISRFTSRSIFLADGSRTAYCQSNFNETSKPSSEVIRMPTPQVEKCFFP